MQLVIPLSTAGEPLFKRIYAGLRKISTIAHATSGTLTPRQFLAGSKDLQAFSTRARALAADFQTFDHRLGVS